MRLHHAASVFRPEVFLTEVEIGTNEGGIISAVVDYESAFSVAAEVSDLLCFGDDFAGPEGLMPVLEDLGSGLKDRFGSGNWAEVETIEGRGIDNRVDGGKNILALRHSLVG